MPILQNSLASCPKSFGQKSSIRHQCLGFLTPRALQISHMIAHSSLLMKRLSRLQSKWVQGLVRKLRVAAVHRHVLAYTPTSGRPIPVIPYSRAAHPTALFYALRLQASKEDLGGNLHPVPRLLTGYKSIFFSDCAFVPQ